MGIIGSFQGYVDSPLYLFNNGVWSNLQTTGMSYSGGNVYKNPGVSYEDINIKLNVQLNWTKFPNPIACYRLNQTINVSSYNYLKINIKVSNAGTAYYMGISTSSTVSSYTELSHYVKASNLSGTNYTSITVNISSASGNYFPYVIWEEKDSGHSTSGAITLLCVSQVYLSTV